MTPRARPRQHLGRDGFEEGVERARAHEGRPVDEERRRPVDAEAAGEGDVGLHGGRVRPLVEGAAEAREVEAAEALGVALGVGAAEAVLVAEEEVVVAPEGRVAALGEHLQRGLGGGGGVGVAGEGEVLPDDPDVVGEGGAEVVEDVAPAVAVGALKVTEDHHGDGRAARAEDGRRPDGDLLAVVEGLGEGRAVGGGAARRRRVAGGAPEEERGEEERAHGARECTRAGGGRGGAQGPAAGRSRMACAGDHVAGSIVSTARVPTPPPGGSPRRARTRSA